jgi:hypothetical protein
VIGGPYRHAAATERLLASLVPIVCPPEAEALGLTGAIVAHVERAIAALEPVARIGLLAGLASYELGAIAVAGRPASRLPRERGARYFEAWWSSRIGAQHELARGVKGLLAMGCYEQPAILAELGYTPDAWIDKVKRRRLEVYGDDVRRAAAAVLAPDPLPGIPPTAPREAVGR